jgi:hypothetical protein
MVVSREGLLDTFVNVKLITEIKERIEEGSWTKQEWDKLTAINYDKTAKEGQKARRKRKVERRNSERLLEGMQHNPWFPIMALTESKEGGLLARIFMTLEHPSKSCVGFQISNLMTFFIFISTTAFLLESMEFTNSSPEECDELIKAGDPLTVEACQPLAHEIFGLVEVVCIMCFTAEYIPKILTVHAVHWKDAGLAKAPANGLVQTLRYARGPFMLIDFGAIFPFYLELLFGVEGSKMAVLRVLRLFRVIRIFKMGNFNKSLMLVYHTVVNSSSALTLMLWVEMIATVLLGSLVYTFESSTYDTGNDWSSNYHCGTERAVFGIFGQEKCKVVAGEQLVPGQYVRPTYDGYELEPSPFTSISISFWWCLTTMTTVGYGDFYPTTIGGKVIGVMCAWFGVVFVAMPISVLGMHFEANYDENFAHDAESREEEANQQKMEKRKDAAYDRQSYPFATRPYFPTGKNWQQRVFQTFEAPSASHLGKVVSITMLLVIGGSVMNFILAAEPAFQEIPAACKKLIRLGKPLSNESCKPEPLPIFGVVEFYCIMIFTVEYLSRVFTVHSMHEEDAGLFLPEIKGEPGKYPHLTALGKTWAYVKIPFNIIDFAAIAPFYITMLPHCAFLGGSFSVLRVLRMLRVFRVLRFPKFNSGLEMILKVISKSIPALTVLVFLGALAMILFGSLIYFMEGNSEYSVDERWLDEFPRGVYIRPTISGDFEPTPFRSIPGAFWWVSVTVTTVGYGDFYPTSTPGRIVGVLLFYFGVVMLALPITILGNNFVIEYGKWEKRHEEEKATHKTEAKVKLLSAKAVLGMAARSPNHSPSPSFRKLKIPTPNANSAGLEMTTPNPFPNPRVPNSTASASGAGLVQDGSLI